MKKPRLLFSILACLTIAWLALYLWVPQDLFPDPYSSLLYSREGELLGARIAPDGQWRFPTSAKPVPEKFEQSLITFEDKRFYWHPGIDPAAILRASIRNVQAGKIVHGGSTLTMQLARLARKNQPRTFSEKIKEMLWAISFEMTYSKQEILKLYASHAPFGGNVVGLETAAWRYFGRKAADLSWAESATLAVLPNAPALIHPGRNREQLLQKRNRLLASLRDEGIIDPTTYELACLEPLPKAPLPLPDKAPHLLEKLALQTPGKQISCSLQAKIQEQAQAYVDRYARKYSANHIYNAAAIIADVETGEIIAYAGNASFPAPPGRGNAVDAACAERSTGSILKPFLYAGMLNDGQLLPSTLVADVPLNINGFAPQNFNRTFYGAVPAHTAIERSLNVPLVRMLSQYNTGRFMILLKKYGMNTLHFPEEHYGASLILGGAEGSLLNLTGMYASMARVLSHYRKYNGRYNPKDIHELTTFAAPAQTPITSPADSRLNDQPVLSSAALWFTAEAMSALNRPEEEAEWQQFGSMKKIAWKTGTSYGGRDAWAIGFTPKYAIGVWIGNASGEGRPGLTGVGYAAPLLFDLFALFPGNNWFDQPFDELTKVPICRISGHKASIYCENTDSVYIPSSGYATPVCPYHRQVHLSPDKRFRVNTSCLPVEQIITCNWFVLPPAQEYYYKHYHAAYRPLPPIMPGCEETEEKSIELIYPEHQAVLFLPKGFDGTQERFVFKAAHARSDARIFWYIDHSFAGTTESEHQLAVTIPKGKHLLTLTDDHGNQRKITFEVK